MATWPDTEELKQVLDITSADFDDTLDRNMAAAVTKVKQDRGGWDALLDEPDDSLAAAALRLGELMGLRPMASEVDAIARDPAYLTYLHGHRRKFGVG